MFLIPVNAFFSHTKDGSLDLSPIEKSYWEIFGCLLAPMPYQKKTLTTTAVSTAASIHAKTVRANPVVPVTTFALDIWNIVKSAMPPIVEAIRAEINILLKLSERLFRAPAM